MAGEAIEFTGNPPTPRECDSQVKYYRNFFEASRDGKWLLLPGGTCIKKDIIPKTGGFGHGRVNGEDTLLFMKLGEAGTFAWLTDPPVLGYFRHADSSCGDPVRGYLGNLVLIGAEKKKEFGSSKTFEKDRIRIVTTHCRSNCGFLMNAREFKAALTLYRQTFFWNFRLRRWKFLVGFWFRMFDCFFRRSRHL